jgi:hypothetical protein
VTEIVGFTLIGVGFVQEMVPTPFAVNERLVVVHVSTLVIGGVIDNVGAVLFCVIICDAVAVHPFAAVTVTVYVPGVVTFNVAFVPTIAVPFDQEYVPPPVAVREMDGVVQVKTVVASELIVAIGAVIFCVIV